MVPGQYRSHAGRPDVRGSSGKGAASAARITTIANYIIDKAEAGWSLQDILAAIRAERSGVTLAEAHAAIREAFNDDASTAVKKLALDHLAEEAWR
jgi:hypothetical protein